MKTKGFTLVELLGVIALLSIIFVLISISTANLIANGKTTTYQKQINTILNAAYDFTLKNLNYLPEDNNTNYVTLGQLKSEGLVEVNIINTQTDKAFPDNLVISIQKVSTDHEIGNTSMLNGNYLYTVEITKLNASSSLLPEIILSVDGTEELEPNTDGNYIMTLNLNDNLPKVNVSATHSKTSDTDLTDQVKQYILHNDVVVETIDTSKPAIYKINYSVVNEDGYATLVVLNIVIGDKTPPTLTFPEGTVISKDVSKFDLLKDVSCQDNSGFCDIEYIDTINYHVEGTYEIKYTVKDPSGNTATQERAIIVE